MNPFLQIGSIVGYMRIVMLLISYQMQKDGFGFFAVTYFISYALDYYDGVLARATHQTSKFRIQLDQATDRVGTLMLMLIAVQIEGAPHRWLLMLWMMSDICGHWMHIYIAELKNIKHKEMKTYFNVLNQYYKSPFIMLPFSLSAELYFLCYIYKHTYKNITVSFFLFNLAVSACAYAKMVLNGLQFVNGCIALAEMDEHMAPPVQVDDKTK